MRRIPELDGLRAIASVLVIAFHASLTSESCRSAFLLRWGWMGVDLFFVVSGYLITTILLRSSNEGASGLLSFFVRRSLRIWPIYYLVLIAFVAANALLPRPQPTAGLTLYLTYTQFLPRYWGADGPAFPRAFAHTWSLAVEEQFYLIWPALLLLMGRKALVPLCLGAAAVAVVSRGWFHLDPQLLLGRCDGLAMGGLLAAAFSARPWAAGREDAVRKGFAMMILVPLAFFLGFAAGTDAERAEPIRASVEILLGNVLFGGVVGLCLLDTGRARLALLRDPRLVALGRISYGLYLYHNLVFSGLQLRFGPTGTPGWAILAGSGLTLAMAALSWRAIERPILAWRDRQAEPGRSPRTARTEVAASRG